MTVSPMARLDLARQSNPSLQLVRDPTTWTILQQYGPDHLGLWYCALPEHQMALITSDCAPSSDMGRGCSLVSKDTKSKAYTNATAHASLGCPTGLQVRPPQLTAATPVENPYRSCELTRRGTRSSERRRRSRTATRSRCGNALSSTPGGVIIFNSIALNHSVRAMQIWNRGDPERGIDDWVIVDQVRAPAQAGEYILRWRESYSCRPCGWSVLQLKPNTCFGRRVGHGAEPASLDQLRRHQRRVKGSRARRAERTSLVFRVLLCEGRAECTHNKCFDQVIEWAPIAHPSAATARASP